MPPDCRIYVPGQQAALEVAAVGTQDQLLLEASGSEPALISSPSCSMWKQQRLNSWFLVLSIPPSFSRSQAPYPLPAT